MNPGDCSIIDSCHCCSPTQHRILLNIDIARAVNTFSGNGHAKHSKWDARKLLEATVGSTPKELQTSTSEAKLQPRLISPDQTSDLYTNTTSHEALVHCLHTSTVSSSWSSWPWGCGLQCAALLGCYMQLVNLTSNKDVFRNELVHCIHTKTICKIFLETEYIMFSTLETA